MNSKGQLGLDTVKKVMIIFLVLAVIVIALALVMVSIRPVAENLDRTTLAITNETLATLTDSDTLAYSSASYRDSACSSIVAVNYTDYATIPSTNYTTTANSDGCTITVGIDSIFNATSWIVNYTATYVRSANTYDMTANITSGTTDFFSNSATIFAIIVVVIIILAIALILAVVSRFGKGGVSGVGGRGSGTVMGV